MKLNQLSIFAENKPGSLNKICKLLAENDIDILTLSLADTTDFGILRIITKDWEKARDVLTRNQIIVRVTDVVAVEVPNRPGGMCSSLDTLSRYSINVEYMYAFAATKAAVIIFRFDAPDVAIEKLKADNAVKFVEPKDIFQ